MKARMKRPMRKLARQFILATAIMLTVPGIARAGDDDTDGKGCSDSTLRGLYIFSASGFNILTGGAAQPKAIVELIRFNADGTLIVPAATVSINGTITQSPANGLGSYTVGADCTGLLQFGPPGPTFDLFVGFKGAELHMIQTNTGTVFQGTADRLSR